MGRHCEVLNPLSIENWDDLLLSHPRASVFHTQGWARVLSETYRYKPNYFSALCDGELEVLVPVMEVNSWLTGRRGVSLPFTDYVPPLTSYRWQQSHIWGDLVEFAQKYKWRHLDLRADWGLQGVACAYDSFYQHEIHLTDNAEHLFSRLSNNNRRNVKKALREGVKIEISNDFQAIRKFFALNCITRKRHGVPSQPFRFFENIYKHIIAQGKGMVVLATENEQAVAGAVYFLFGDKAIYKYGASIKAKSSLRANNLVMWEAIVWLLANGCKSLDLGRTDKNNEGLLRYKTSWGAEQNTINYYRYSVESGRFVSGKDRHDSIGNSFFRLAPLTVSTFLGGVLYRHVG